MPVHYSKWHMPKFDNLLQHGSRSCIYEYAGMDIHYNKLLQCRRGSGIHKGIDVKCTNAGKDIYAPIDGELQTAKPYGDGSCVDDGFKILGSGDWSGKIKDIILSMYRLG